MADWLMARFGHIKNIPLHIQLRRFRWVSFPMTDVSIPDLIDALQLPEEGDVDKS